MVDNQQTEKESGELLDAIRRSLRTEVSRGVAQVERLLNGARLATYADLKETMSDVVERLGEVEAQMETLREQGRRSESKGH